MIRFMHIAKRIGLNIRFARKVRGLTLSELARFAGYAKSSLCDWEQGDKQPFVGALDNLAEVLGITPGELIDGPPMRSHAP